MHDTVRVTAARLTVPFGWGPRAWLPAPSSCDWSSPYLGDRRGELGRGGGGARLALCSAETPGVPSGPPNRTPSGPLGVSCTRFPILMARSCR